MVQTLIAIGKSLSQIHLTGFSFCAHLASYVAKTISGIGRITGKYIIILYNPTMGLIFTSQTGDNRKLEILSPKLDLILILMIRNYITTIYIYIYISVYIILIII
jgi:hypothetical protein